eukprot:TRINITY_DN7959_c0_g1_i1.p1 TRINITY_DN7959_c0_g1~~TRINITY_DN7959_c0_g1_i1.p1  ORF type:complete len:764 (-),score=184.81 TRINITY_DN7959_c0_g1_i1:144-2435(-)
MMCDGGTSSMLSFGISQSGISADSRRFDSFADAGVWGYAPSSARAYSLVSPSLGPSCSSPMMLSRSGQLNPNFGSLDNNSLSRSPTSPSNFSLIGSPSPPREENRGMVLEDKASDGDSARLEHDQIIYGALLEECDDRSCAGFPAKCLKAHAWNQWQTVRRDPRVFNYGSKLCSFYSEGSCQKGDQCSFAHSKTEVQFHPKVYKTQACNRYAGSRYCGNKLCAFYHVFDDGSDDSRKLPDSQLDALSPGSLEENVWLDRTTPIISRAHSSANSPSVPASPRFCKSISLQKPTFLSQAKFGAFIDQNQPVWTPHWKRTLERSTSEMKLPERRVFHDPIVDVYRRGNLPRERSMTPPLPSTLKDNVEMTQLEAARYHWSIEHLDLKMKNPNRKESQFGLNLLAWVPDFPLRELIKSLNDENWTVEQLRSYLSHTLVRALEEKKVVLSDNGKTSGFNTGLVPPSSSYSMVAVLCYTPVQQGSKFEWTLTNFKTPAEIGTAKTLPAIPAPVCYMDGKSDMWFDVNKHVLPFGEQLLGRVIDRIAEARTDILNHDSFVQMAVLEKAMKNAENNVMLNPNCAVPSFYRPKGQLHGSVQFLLPISFTDDTSRVDGALAVQERSQGYVACTVLSLQDAYAHARLIGKPTASWLSAVCAAEGDLRPAGAMSSPAGRLLLDRCGGLEITYQDQFVPRLFIVSADEKLLDREVQNEILIYLKKFGVREILLKTNQTSGRVEWEVILNIADYANLLQKYGKASSVDMFLQGVVTL